jgi:uncharacterized membrane protein YqjE
MSPDPTTQHDDRSVADLLKDLADETGTLVRQEIELARVEMTKRGQEVGKDAGIVGAGVLVALLAAGALTAFLISLLATAMETWIAALIVTVVFAAIAGVLILAGKKRLQKDMPPTPDQTIETVKEDVQWAKTRTRSATK